MFEHGLGLRHDRVVAQHQLFAAVDVDVVDHLGRGIGDRRHVGGAGDQLGDEGEGHQHAVVDGRGVDLKAFDAAQLETLRQFGGRDGADVDLVRADGDRPQHGVHLDIEVEGAAVGEHVAERAQALLKGVRARDRALGVHDEQAVAVLERRLHLLEELAGVEHRRGAERIGHVHDHGVERARGGLDVLPAVTDLQLVTLVLEGALVDLGHEAVAEVDHAAVQLGHHRGVDRVLQHFAQDAAIAGADDEHVLGIGVAGQRDVHHRLVVHLLVLLGDLGHAVEQQHAAEFVGLDDLHRLPLGLALVQALLH